MAYSGVVLIAPGFALPLPGVRWGHFLLSLVPGRTGPMAKLPKDVEAYFKAIPEPRRSEAMEVFQFVAESVPKEVPYVVKGIVGFGTFHYKGRTCEGEWLKVGMACNKASFSVYSCASDSKGMLAEQHADQLGKVDVGKSCIRFKKWADVNKPALRKLLKQSMKCQFGFG